jgi:HK97 family phage major capsid protein
MDTNNPLVGLRAKTVSSASPSKILGELLWAKILGDGDLGEVPASERVSKAALDLVTKSSSPAFPSSSLTASDTSIVISRMIAANGPRGVFETMAPSMYQVPIHGRVIVRSGTVLSGGVVAEGAAAPCRRFNVAELNQTMSKLVAEVAVTTEAMQQSPELTQAILASALPEALTRAVDSYFVGTVLQASGSGESSGETNPTWSQCLNDLEELLRLVRAGSASRLFFIMAPRSAKFLSRLAFENGVTTATYDGGSIMGVPILVGQDISGLTLADASAVVYADSGVELRGSDNASIELSDAPTGDSASATAQSVNYVSAFQSGMRILRAERRLNAKVVDTSGVATLTGINWGAGADSPAGS